MDLKEEMLKEKIKKYWDERSLTYDSSLSHSGLKDIWKNILKNLIKNNKNLKVLDVGTGTGFLALILAELGHQVTALDLSFEMLKRAYIKSKKEKQNIYFILGDAENPPFKKESFDLIVCRHLLWTLPNPEKALKAWYKLLKPEGILLIFDGKWQGENIFEKILDHLYKFLYFRKQQKLNKIYEEIKESLPFYGGTLPENIKNILLKVGFEVEEIKILNKIKKKLMRNFSFIEKLSWFHKYYYLIKAKRY